MNRIEEDPHVVVCMYQIYIHTYMHIYTCIYTYKYTETYIHTYTVCMCEYYILNKMFVFANFVIWIVTIMEILRLTV